MLPHASKLRKKAKNSTICERVCRAVLEAAEDGQVECVVSTESRMEDWELREMRRLGYKVYYDCFLREYEIRWS